MTRSAAMTPAERKRLQRGREKAMDMKRIAITVTPAQEEQLTWARTTRGGLGGAYDMNEYILTLIRRDAERLKRDLSQLGLCPSCGVQLPRGCGGAGKDRGDCWHHPLKNQLQL